MCSLLWLWESFIVGDSTVVNVSKLVPTHLPWSEVSSVPFCAIITRKESAYILCLCAGHARRAQWCANSQGVDKGAHIY